MVKRNQLSPWQLFLCSGMLLLPAITANADSLLTGEKIGRGYFWYEDPPVVKEVKPNESKPSVDVAGAKADKVYSVEWVAKHFPKLLNESIDNPTPENIANLAYMRRIMIDRSQKFAEINKQVVALDPFLDEENRAPTSEWANIVSTRAIRKDKDDVFKFLGQQGGIWVFVDKPEKCAACKQYTDTVIRDFAEKYAIPLKVISVSTTEGAIAAQNLKLKVTPTTVYVHPASKNYFVLSQGLLSQSQISDRLIIAGNAYNLFPKEIAEKANPYSKGLIAEDEISGTEIDPNNPAAAMKLLRDRIAGKNNVQ